MILGHVTGRSTTTHFQVLIKGDAKKFDYLQAVQQDHYVLAQIVEIEQNAEERIAYCNLLGYKDENHHLKGLQTPLEPGTEVLRAEDEFIQDILGLASGTAAAYIGTLDGRDNIKIHLDLNTLLTKHVAILAKSGAGKSYAAAVLLEEMLEKKIPILIIDPHGEYVTLREPNIEGKDPLDHVGLTPKSYSDQVQEFSPDTATNPSAKPLKLSHKDLTPTELIHLLPAKLTNAQLGAFYAALRNLGGTADFDQLILELENDESSMKWTLIHILDYVRKLRLFSDAPTRMAELIQPGKASIITLRGIAPEIQEVVVCKLASDLFLERKKGNIPPFFLVLEEGHNFIPERTYGETKSSSILRQIFSEGRKFGLGVCVISQRPSRIEKNALSQVTTQIILKVTNPHDLRAISHSVEGITAETENALMSIPIGTALVTGLVDLPLFVKIRPRRSRHGGNAVSLLSVPEQDLDALEELQDEEAKGELLATVRSETSLHDLKVMHGPDAAFRTVLVPCLHVTGLQEGRPLSVLINLHNGHFVRDLQTGEGTPLKALDFSTVSPQQQRVLTLAFALKQFKPAELFAQSGMQFSEVYDVVQLLTKKGFFQKAGDRYDLSEPCRLLTRLDQFSLFEPVEFQHVAYDSKQEARVDVSKLLTYLRAFLEVQNDKECWLVTHQKIS